MSNNPVARWAGNPTVSGQVVHGLGLRPTRADLTRPDAALIAEYTAGVDRAVRANRGRAGRERMLEAAAGWGSKR